MKLLRVVATSILLTVLYFGTAPAWDEPCEKELKVKVSGKLSGHQWIVVSRVARPVLSLNLDEGTLKVEGGDESYVWPPARNRQSVFQIDLDLLMFERSTRIENDDSATIYSWGCLHKDSHRLGWKITLVVIRASDNYSYNVWTETVANAKRPLPIIINP